MKLKMFAAAAMLAVSGASFADTTNLGVIDADPTLFSHAFGRLFGFGAPVGPFTDYYTFSISSPATATGGAIVWRFGSVSLDMTGVSLTGGTLGAAVLFDPTPSSFSFSNLGIGTYTLSVSGMLRDVGLGGAAGYTGEISALSAPVPEAGTYAMLFVGLTAAGVMGLRRNRQS